MKTTPVHSTASFVDPAFEQAFFRSTETYIHPSAHVGPDVELDIGAKIGPNAIVVGKTFVGARTQIHAHSVVGTPAQSLNVREPLGTVVIGSDSVIREFVTIGAPDSEAGTTTIGNHCYIMNFAHIAHDVTLEDHVTMTNNAQIAGHAHIESHALLMAHAMVHQFCRIGSYSALAPFSGCRQDIPPFGLYSKMPAVFTGLNIIKLKRAGIAPESRSALKTLSHLFYMYKMPLSRIEEELVSRGIHEDPAVQSFMAFVKNSTRGISRQSLT